MSTEEMTRRIRGAPTQAGDGHARFLQAAWQRVSRDAERLASVYQQAGRPADPVPLGSSTRQRDPEQVPVWLLTPYQPAQRVRSRWSWRSHAETIPEVLGIALGEDATLYAYVLVKDRPRLTAPLCDAKPDAPPPHTMFAELVAQVAQQPGDTSG